MENAAAAISKVFAKAPAADQLKDDVLPQDSTNTPSTTATADKDASTTVDAQVAAPVEHTHVKKQHETREQVVVDKDIHKDHYHTTVQPLKDSEVLPEKHDYTQETKTKAVERDDGAARAKAERDAAGLKDTKDVERSETAAREPTEVNEHVHHHVHETVVPVVEKGEVLPILKMVM